MDQVLLELGKALIECNKGNICFLKTDPEIIDFTDKNFCFCLELFWSGGKFSLNVNKSNYLSIYSMMKQSIFKNNKLKIISYNFKNYCSVYYSLTKKNIEIESLVMDLKILSPLLGNKILNSPSNLKDAYNYLKKILEGNWDKIKEVYFNIHLPLITKVIPGIENVGLLDIEEKKIKKSYYEIEAQENSRLSSYNCLSNCFLPMNLKKEEKEKYIPINQEDCFLYFDYKNMEVSILENLTKDPELTKILTGYDDFYEGIYREIINKDGFDKDKRKKIKGLFLPYIYGASEQLISNKNNIEIDTVREITSRIKQTFKKTFNWLEDYTNSHDENFYYKNKFGKIRKIEEKYKSINFIVQSTASMFCLDKLIDIYNILNNDYLCFYIHDGYGFSLNQKDLKKTANTIKNILLEENKNFKEMILNVSCSYGRNLNNMLEYKFED